MSLSRKILFLTIFVGVSLRVLIFIISPPGNSYDNHMEVVKTYSEEFDRPAPFDLWQSYQPPVYYCLAAAVYQLVGLSDLFVTHSWKFVQSINVLMSIILMFVINRILIKGRVPLGERIFALSLLAVFPRDIFTSVMIGNDYLLLFLSVLSFGIFLSIIEEKFVPKNKSLFLKTTCLYSLVAVACLTKQHGFILFILPLAICIKQFLENGVVAFRKHLISLCLVLCLASVDEVWKYTQTGHVFVSNQNHFDYADKQYPGDLRIVEFTTFRFIRLLETPFLSEETSASVPTEIFARAIFDYEWRFSHPDSVFSLGMSSVIYIYGLILVIYMVWRSVFIVRNHGIKAYGDIGKYLLPAALLFVCVLYLFVPIVQTIRFPHFSSMKAMFSLPGIVGLIILQSIWCNKAGSLSLVTYLFSFLNIVIGTVYFSGIAIEFSSISNILSGPIWQLP